METYLSTGYDTISGPTGSDVKEFLKLALHFSLNSDKLVHLYMKYLVNYRAAMDRDLT